MNPHLEEFGAAVKAARKAKGWSLEALAADALGNGDRKGYCSQVERGQRNLSMGTIKNLARALDLPDEVTAKALLADTPDTDQAEAVDAATEKLLTEVEGLRGQLKLSEALAVAIAYDYAEGNPTDIEGALNSIRQAFQVAADQDARDQLPSNIDEAVDRVLAEVARLNRDGDTKDADALLEAEIEARAETIERERAAQTRLIERGLEQAKLTNDAEAFARRTWLAIQIEQPDLMARLQRMLDEFVRLYNDGLRFGTPFALTAAVALCDQIAAHAPTPEINAMAQNNKGEALRNQGARTDGAEGAALLAQAVAAYNAALEVRTRADHPVGSAMTQMNKGNALANQGIRTEAAEGAALLAQAVAAYDAALEVRTREEYLVEWAMTQSNKANALSDLGIRTEGAEGAALLAQAVAAYDAALEVRTREKYPMEWAMTQSNKGNTLSAQGIRTEGAEGAALLARAVAAHDAALEVRTRADHPVDWAMTQENLALAKKEWAAHDSADDPRSLLDAALAHVDAALKVFDPEHLSFDHTNATRLRDSIRAKLDALG